MDAVMTSRPTAQERGGETCEERAKALAQEYAPRLGNLRTPAYERPLLSKLKLAPTCDGEFAAALSGVMARATFDTLPADVVRLLRFHRMYGLGETYKRGLTGVDFMHDEPWRKDKFFNLVEGLSTLVGDWLLNSFESLDKWFPFNNFSVMPEGECGFVVRAESLQAHPWVDGQFFYSSTKRPTVAIGGVRRRLAFAQHALERLAERVTASKSYASYGDAFGIVEDSHYYLPAMLHGSQPGIAIFDHCVPHYFSSAYAEEILGTLEEGVDYVWRVGYAPLTQIGEFWVAKTVLAPGFLGTPEYWNINRSSFDPGVKEQMLKRCAEQGYRMLCSSRDFGLLRWFHRHGVPQVLKHSAVPRVVYI